MTIITNKSALLNGHAPSSLIPKPVAKENGNIKRGDWDEDGGFGEWQKDQYTRNNSTQDTKSNGQHTRNNGQYKENNSHRHTNGDLSHHQNTMEYSDRTPSVNYNILCISVNKKMLILKLLFFTFYGAFGCLLPYVTIHMRHLGLSMEEVTWINMVLPLSALFGAPVVSILADRMGHYRLITIVCMLLTAVLHTSLLFVPPTENGNSISSSLLLTCNSSGAALMLDPCGGTCPTEEPNIDASFRIWNCSHSCSDGDEAGNIDPVMRLYSASSNEFISFADPSTQIKFSRSLHRHYLLDTISRHQCVYPQLDFNTASGSQYTGMTCSKAPDNCIVVCNAEELANGSHLLQSSECMKSSGNVPGSRRLTFWVYFVARSLGETCNAVLIALLDAVALTMVEQHKGDFGREKISGILAIAIFAPLCGMLVDADFGMFSSYSYGPVFYVFDALMLISALITGFLHIDIHIPRRSLVSNFRILARCIELRILLLLVIILGAFSGYLKTFIYIHLLENLLASKLLLGLTTSISVILSLPFLYKSASVLDYCGHHYIIMLAFVGYCIRFTGFSYITEPWWSLPLEALEPFTLNLMMVSAATLAYKLAPKDLVATAQSLLWVSHYNIGRFVGIFIGGYITTEYGNYTVFKGAAVLSAVFGALYLAIYQFIKYKRGHQSPQAKPSPVRENGVVPNGHYVPVSGDDTRC